MRAPRLRDQSAVQDAREAYFAGKISAGEYLRCALPINEPVKEDSEQDERMADQFRRILSRLSQRTKV